MGFMIKAFSLFGCIGSREERREGKGRATESPIQSRGKTHNWIGETFEIMELDSRNLRRMPESLPAPLRGSKDRNNCTIERGKEGDGRKAKKRGRKEGLRFACQSKVDQR